jgi:hypothetical protein
MGNAGVSEGHREGTPPSFSKVYASDLESTGYKTDQCAASKKSGKSLGIRDLRLVAMFFILRF